MTRLLLFSATCLAMAAATTFQSEIAEWRRAREERLKADGGWLTRCRTLLAPRRREPLRQGLRQRHRPARRPGASRRLRAPQREGDRAR